MQQKKNGLAIAFSIHLISPFIMTGASVANWLGVAGVPFLQFFSVIFGNASLGHRNTKTGIVSVGMQPQ